MSPKLKSLYEEMKPVAKSLKVLDEMLHDYSPNGTMPNTVRAALKQRQAEKSKEYDRISARIRYQKKKEGTL